MSYQAFRSWSRQPVDRPDLSIVVPAYNEEIRILPTLGAIAVTVAGLGIDWELIVSDDGSSDTTCELVRSLEWSNLRLIEHPNTGKGGAVRRGVMAARGQWILFSDADNSTPIEELSRLLTSMHDGADVVVGSRAAAGAVESNRSAVRGLVSNSLRSMVRMATGVGVRDTQCGFKLFERTAAQILFAQMRNEGFSFDLELLYLARKHGMLVDEVPVTWYDAPGSKVDSVRDSLRFLRDIVRIRKADLRGEYVLEPAANPPATANGTGA